MRLLAIYHFLEPSAQKQEVELRIGSQDGNELYLESLSETGSQCHGRRSPSHGLSVGFLDV